MTFNSASVRYLAPHNLRSLKLSLPLPQTNAMEENYMLVVSGKMSVLSCLRDTSLYSVYPLIICLMCCFVAHVHDNHTCIQINLCYTLYTLEKPYMLHVNCRVASKDHDFVSKLKELSHVPYYFLHINFL